MHRHACFLIAALFFPTISVASPTTEAKEAPRLIVFGVDRTASMDTNMTRLGLALAEQTLRHDLHPGDTIVYRWISDRSYATDQVFAQVNLPNIPDAKGNALDRKLKIHIANAQATLVEQARQGLAQLRRYQSVQSPIDLSKGTNSTDVMGFLAAAAEQLKEAMLNRQQPVLMLVSDLEHNEEQAVKPDLKGVKVIVYMVNIKGDAVLAQQLKQHWQSFFEESGAESVVFRPAVLRH